MMNEKKLINWIIFIPRGKNNYFSLYKNWKKKIKVYSWSSFSNIHSVN